MQIKTSNVNSTCRPLTITKRDHTDGIRIGGNPPLGVVPSKPTENTRYIATIPADALPGHEISIFTSFSEDSDDPSWYAKGVSVLHNEESKLVQMVVHPAARRSKRSQYSSTLASHGMRVEAERRDGKTEETGVWTHHKLGGFPFVYRFYKDLRDEVYSSFDDGFTVLVQLASPGAEDHIPEGDWPFGNNIFVLFAKKTGDAFSFRYVWG